MDEKKGPSSPKQQNTTPQPAHEKVKNPFENHQSAEKDIAQSQEELDKEQQFKETLTERD